MEMKEVDELSNKVIGIAIDVHRNLGPGLLESVYKQCLAYEFYSANIRFEIEKEIPIKCKKVNIDCSFRADFIIEDNLILEFKTVGRILPIHKTQLLTYLKLTSIRLGIIINFNVKLLKNGIKRVIL